MLKEKFSPREDASSFKARHGVDRDEYLSHMDYLISLSKSLGFGPSSEKSELLSSILSPFNLFQMEKTCSKYGIKISDAYVANSYGLRSDEFIKHEDNDPTHVLFAGCSMTFGDGILMDHLWSYKLYKEISKEQKLSGYFNVALNGGTIIEILTQVINYINLFGMPSQIFIMLPENTRDVEMGKVVSQDFADKIILSLYNSILLMTKSFGAKLYTITWNSTSTRDDSYILSGKDRFYKFEDRTKAMHIFNFCENNSKDIFKDYHLSAMDLTHPGIAEQDFYYSLLAEKVTGNKYLMEDV